MILPYHGEFLISPCPLELSLFACSHSCAFCFATHSNFRDADVPALMRLLADYPRRKTLTAHLLQQGYPICVSNKTDPFSKSNHRQSLAILRVLTACGIPVQLQTRGGPAVSEVLEWLPPSVWYVSVGSLDEALTKRLEPGAPSVASRLDMMRTLKAAGHRVVVGFNPCVPEWAPDPGALLAACQVAGAECAWIEPLHLNSKQEAALRPWERDVLTEPLIRRARKRALAPESFEHVMRARGEAERLGLAHYTGGQPNASQFWQAWRDCYPKTFPTLQDWVNHLHATAAGVVSFSDFAGFFLPGLPDVPIDGSKYIMTSTSNHTWNDHPEWNSRMGYPEVLAALWCEPRIKLSPACMPCFSYVGERTGDGWAHVLGDDGMPLMRFCAGGTDGYWVEG